MIVDPVRLGAAALMTAGYLAMCVRLLRRPPALPPSPTGGADWLVAYATQTGTAEYLALQTADMLRTGGLAARSVSVDQLDAATLAASQRILFIVSTYGEGDAPDSAARLARLLSDGTLALGQLHYAVLALGDSSYTHFCGFGHTLDGLLARAGGQRLFDTVPVDRGAAGALETWRHHLSHLAGTSDAPDWSAPAYQPWQLLERRLMNPGSAGAPVYQIALAPPAGSVADWQAGDLVQVNAPGDPDYPREYSIASIAAEGSLKLLVRLHLRDDGSDGVASGWLCRGADAGATIALRTRAHARFRLGDNAQRPLILIGNGTGMAGLRAHLAQRVRDGQTRNWLVFGERNAAADYFYRDDIERWQQAGMLEQCSLAFSRDGGPQQQQQRYVQHALARQANLLRAWVADGAAIYICGSLQGMAGAVHQTLLDTLGQPAMDQLDQQGRYRRDVY